MSPAAAQGGEGQPREVRRWGMSLGVVLALHAVLLIGLALWLRPHAAPPVPPPPPAVMVDLAPTPDPAPTPQPPTPQPPQPPQRVETPRLAQAVTPTPPTVTTAAVSLPAEPPRPQPAPPSPPAPRPPPPAAAAPPAPSPPPSRALPTWQGQVLGQLQRLKRYPDSALFHHQQGTVWLRFAMNREGRVLSASLDRSSGVDSLDAEALALVRRAQPLPKPPADVPGERLELVAPIEFFLSQRR